MSCAFFRFSTICVPGWSKRRLAVGAAVARCTFPSQNVKTPTCSDHFNHFRKLEVRKENRPLWREAHFQAKMLRQPTCSDRFCKFGVQNSARRCGEFVLEVEVNETMNQSITSSVWVILSQVVNESASEFVSKSGNQNYQIVGQLFN